jgi:acyl-CoA synthetase (AMP-forming)/AMP-acid ligase II
MEGYLDQPEATAAVLHEGWLDTGDLGFVHDGQLFLTGRAKDVLILRGRNHSPHEVEEAVGAVPGVRAGCAVAVSWLPEGDTGERLLLLVEARREVAPASYPQIVAACAAAVRAAAGLHPDHVEVLAPGTLPRTSSGKLRRSETLRRWLAGELVPPSPVTALRVLAAAARSRLAFARVRLEPDERP